SHDLIVIFNIKEINSPTMDVEGWIKFSIKVDLTLLDEVLNKRPKSYASVSAMPNITVEFPLFVRVIA
ncbi:hypothetical protein U1Q18_042426, partial [Sarracenia purpurea var. burkii]